MTVKRLPAHYSKGTQSNLHGQLTCYVLLVKKEESYARFLHSRKYFYYIRQLFSALR